MPSSQTKEENVDNEDGDADDGWTSVGADGEKKKKKKNDLVCIYLHTYIYI